MKNRCDYQCVSTFFGLQCHFFYELSYSTYYCRVSCKLRELGIRQILCKHSSLLKVRNRNRNSNTVTECEEMQRYYWEYAFYYGRPTDQNVSRTRNIPRDHGFLRVHYRLGR